MNIIDDEDEPLAEFLESEIFALSDQDEEVEDDMLNEGEVKRKGKCFKVEDGDNGFDGEDERAVKKMRVMDEENEEEEEVGEKREAKMMKVEEEEEEEEEKVKALLLLLLSPSTKVEAEVECAPSPPRMSQSTVDSNNDNGGASTSNNMRLFPNRIETGILSKVPPELIHHILKFLSPEDLVACSLICKFLNRAASDEYLWRRLYCLRWGLPPTSKPRECAWKKLYIQRDAQDMVEFVKHTPAEFKEYYIQMQAAKRSQAPLPSQVNDDRIILDKTVADQVSTWKKSKGLDDNVVTDHACSGETCTYYQIGDVFVCERTGNVHVCDDTCREVSAVADPVNGLMVCTISGHCSERMLSPSEMEQDGELQEGGAIDEAEPFMGKGRFAQAYILGYGCNDEKELEDVLRFC